MTSGEGLEIQGLEVSYGAVRALRGVSLHVPRGSFVAVLGANGAGKTTLVRSITGLLPLQGGRIRAGSITLDGEPLTTMNTRLIVKAGVAQVLEGRKLFSQLTVEENLLCGAASRSDRGEIADSLADMWELFPQIERLRNQTAGLLSGGEQQMVAVGRALMSRPELLICDELSLGLAPMIVQQLFSLLTELNTTRGTSLLIIEQNARLAMAHAGYAYVLELGEVLLEGESAKLREDSHVQDLYLGGEGEAREAYQSISRPEQPATGPQQEESG